jgi:hypothetical protein
MSMPRKDVRFKLDEADHHDLLVIASIDGVEIHEWCESVIRNALLHRVQAAMLIADRRARRGKSGSGGE